MLVLDLNDRCLLQMSDVPIRHEWDVELLDWRQSSFVEHRCTVGIIQICPVNAGQKFDVPSSTKHAASILKIGPH